MKQNSYRAFLFDLNGTMIDDMAYHIRAWHRIANALGANLSLERAKEECYGKNAEFLERVFPGIFTDAEKERMGLEKEKGYQEEFRPHLKLINGLDGFLHEARQQNLKLAIGTAAIRFNVDFVLDGLGIRSLFDAVICAEDVALSKPHPETFLKCAEVLDVDPKHCLVFEDTPKGVEAAYRAGMDSVVITTLHQPKEFSNDKNIVSFIADYHDEQLSRYLCLKQNV